MTRATARYFGLIASVAVVGLLFAVIATRFIGATADPEGELISQVKGIERDGLTLDVPGAPAPLVSSKLRYDRFSVWLDPGGEKAWVACTLDLTGKIDAIEVGALSVEKIPFVREGRDWKPEHGYAPQLAAVLSALEQRRASLTSNDPAKLSRLLLPKDGLPPPQQRVAADPELAILHALRDPRYDVKAWYVRADRDEAIVSEDYRLQGSLPDRPLDQQALRRLTLTRSGSEFFFSPGLM